MSDPNLFNIIIANWSSYPLVIAVMFASVVGSSHCVSMCGPITILLKNNRGNIHFYNVGRLISYLSLGIVAGTVGKEFLSSKYGLVSVISTILISVVIIYLGFKLVFDKKGVFHLPNFFSSLFSSRLKWLNGLHASIRSLIIGIINGFIPCGWLYVFVLASITLKSSLLGAVFMFFFWVGTVPALTFIPILSERVFKVLPVNIIRVAGLVLILAGVFNLMINFFPTEDNHHHGHKISKSVLTLEDKYDE